MRCRGIHFDGGICKILYETNDIPVSERSKFNTISMTSNKENLLVNGNIANTKRYQSSNKWSILKLLLEIGILYMARLLPKFFFTKHDVDL